MPTYDFRCPQGHVFEKLILVKVDGSHRADMIVIPCEHPGCQEQAQKLDLTGARYKFFFNFMEK